MSFSIYDRDTNQTATQQSDNDEACSCDRENPIEVASLGREWRIRVSLGVEISAAKFSDKTEPLKIDQDVRN